MMKRLFYALLVISLMACGGIQGKLEKTAGPPTAPPPKLGTAAELAAGTATTARSWSPKTLSDTYSGAAAEVSDAAVGAAGDTDTTHAYSKDDIHDYVAQHDSDYDGLPDGTEAGAVTAAMVAADVATQAELDAAAALVDTDDEIIAIINASPSTQIGVPAGGSGAATFTDGGLLVGAGAGAFEALAVGLTTQILVGGGAGTNPVWGTDLPTAVTIGTGYIYRAGGTDVPDADVADNITVHFNGLGTADGAASADLGNYQHLLNLSASGGAIRLGTGTSYFEVVNNDGTNVIVRLVGANITANLGTFTVSTDAVHAQTGTTADDDLYLAARDVDGAAYVNMVTLKAGNEPYAYFGPQANGWRVDQTGAVTRIGTASLATVEVDRIPITAFTDGAAPPAAAAVISSADGRFNCRAFDGASNEDVFFTWKAPADIDATQGIKFSVSGVVGAATAPANTEVVAFSLAGVSIGNSDAAGSVGTPQTSSLTADATYAQYDSLDTAFSSAITVTNLAAGETVSLKLIRLATTTDTYAQDFHPHTILIKYVSLNNASF